MAKIVHTIRNGITRQRGTPEYNEYHRDRMRRVREAKLHPCPGPCGGRNQVLKGLCRSCAAKEREARIARTGNHGNRGKHHSPKPRRLAHAPVPTAASQIVISNVYVLESGLLTPEQKFRGGFVTNVHPDHQALMLQTAVANGFKITFGAPLNAQNPKAIGVYVETLDPDPKRLIEAFRAAQVGAMTRRMENIR